MKVFLRSMFVVCIVLGVYSYKQTRILPAYTHCPDVALKEPNQSRTKRPDFEAAVEHEIHTVHPLYEYSIAGMVVSYGFSKSLAKRRKDNLNILDVGLIWGTNLSPRIYRNLNFETDGVWLKVKTKDQATWKNFDPECLSNNHLITNDPRLIKKIRSIKRGDIIQIEGCLASYADRKSSINRSDTGDQACEIIWVDKIEYLKSGNQPWRRLLQGSLAGIFVSIGVSAIRLFSSKIPHKLT